jgi:hypothetical protein
VPARSLSPGVSLAKLEAVLERRGLASARDVDEALARLDSSGGDLITSLLQFVELDEAELSEALSECYELPAAQAGPLPAAGPEHEAARRLPREVAERYCCIPLESADDRLLLAVARPLDPAFMEELGFALGAPIAERIAPEVRIREAIARHYRSRLAAHEERAIARLNGDLEALSLDRSGTRVRAHEDLASASAPSHGATSEQAEAVSDERRAQSRLPSQPPLPEMAAALPSPSRASDSPPALDARTSRRRRPSSLATARAELSRAATRQDVIDTFFGFACQFFEYGALFAVHRSLAEGLDAWGPGTDREAIQAVGVPLDLPSSLSAAAESCTTRVTRLGRDGIDRMLAADLRRFSERRVLILPICLRGRCTMLLYGDNGASDVIEHEVSELIALAPDVANALARIILLRKREGRASGDPLDGTRAPGVVSSHPPAAPEAFDVPAANSLAGSAGSRNLDRSRSNGRGSVRPAAAPPAALVQPEMDPAPRHALVAIEPAAALESDAGYELAGAGAAESALREPTPTPDEAVFLLRAPSRPRSTPVPPEPVLQRPEKPLIAITHPNRSSGNQPRLPSVMVDASAAEIVMLNRSQLTQPPSSRREGAPARPKARVSAQDAMTVRPAGARPARREAPGDQDLTPVVAQNTPAPAIVRSDSPVRVLDRERPASAAQAARSGTSPGSAVPADVALSETPLAAAAAPEPLIGHGAPTSPAPNAGLASSMDETPLASSVAAVAFAQDHPRVSAAQTAPAPRPASAAKPMPPRSNSAASGRPLALNGARPLSPAAASTPAASVAASSAWPGVPASGRTRTASSPTSPAKPASGGSMRGAERPAIAPGAAMLSRSASTLPPARARTTAPVARPDAKPALSAPAGEAIESAPAPHPQLAAPSPGLAANGAPGRADTAAGHSPSLASTAMPHAEEAAGTARQAASPVQLTVPERSLPLEQLVPPEQPAAAAADQAPALHAAGEATAPAAAAPSSTGDASEQPSMSAPAADSKAPPAVESIPAAAARDSKLPIAPEPEIDLLVDQVCQGSLKAAQDLARIGAPTVQRLMARFPGPVVSERAGPSSRASECGPLLQALANIGSPAVPDIMRSSEDQDERVRRWATLLLGEMPGPEACQAVVQRLADEAPRVHQAALDAARLLLSSSAANLFRKTLFEVAEAESAPLTLRLRTLEHVARLRDSASVPRLIRFLGLDTEAVVHKALWVLSVITRQDFGRNSERWWEWWHAHQGQHRLEWLIESLDHADARLRKAAADELLLEARDSFGFSENAPHEERLAAQTRYAEWWRTLGARRFGRSG